jgi:hypothetical protein
MQVLLSLPISRFTGHAHTGLYGNGFIKQRWLHPPLLSAQGFVPVINGKAVSMDFDIEEKRVYWVDLKLKVNH